MKKTLLLSLFVLLPLALWAANSQADRDDDDDGNEHVEHTATHVDAWSAITEAVAVIHPTEGNSCRGVVRFTQDHERVKIVAHIEGLAPGSQHAIHVHQYGDCSSHDGTSAGGHYNPEGHPHALPDERHRHAGDLGNLWADENGQAHYEITVDNISIADLKNPIIGRGVIVHAKSDDGGQPTGNAGSRIGFGVIGIAKPSQN